MRTTPSTIAISEPQIICILPTRRSGIFRKLPTMLPGDLEGLITQDEWTRAQEPIDELYEVFTKISYAGMIAMPVMFGIIVCIAMFTNPLFAVAKIFVPVVMICVMSQYSKQYIVQAEQLVQRLNRECFHGALISIITHLPNHKHKVLGVERYLSPPAHHPGFTHLLQFTRTLRPRSILRCTLRPVARRTPPLSPKRWPSPLDRRITLITPTLPINSADDASCSVFSPPTVQIHSAITQQ